MKKSSLLVISMFAMAIPFALEFLLSAGVLKEHGSTVEDRRPVYNILMATGLGGLIIYLLTNPLMQCVKTSK